MNYNLSSFSEVLEVNRPDIIPPVPPVIENYKASDTSIYFKWIPSSSQDVVKHILYRREKYTTVWNPVYQTESKINVYNDKDVKIKKEYEYVIVAVDGANFESERKQIVTASLIDFGFRPAIKDIEVKTDRLKKQVQLEWKYEHQKPEKFLIYRSVKGSPLRLYRSVTGNEASFTDKQVVMNTIYVYRIKASYTDGGESPLSKELEIKY
ncbi:MAG: fibronectin type III domain-containing protein [Cytophagaceae bacterium]|nr:fibronectin type III domain-containing protein [Cytophagaceae bacterium]